MTVVVTESGLTIPLIVAYTEHGAAGSASTVCCCCRRDEVEDPEMAETLVEYAKAGERGLSYKEDDEEGSDPVRLSAPSGALRGDQSGDPEPVEGYADLNSPEAEQRYEDEQDEDVKASILQYELAHKNRAWAQWRPRGPRLPFDQTVTHGLAAPILLAGRPADISLAPIAPHLSHDTSQAITQHPELRSRLLLRVLIPVCRWDAKC
jgi:hypothetical protein